MEIRARLIDVAIPDDALAGVLVLHGGSSRGTGAMVSPAQLSVLRMIPIAKRIARAGRGSLAVHRLLNSHRGWHADRTPVDDVNWALDELAQRNGGPLPTCLVGHSLGGRAALFAAARPEVRSAVALAPWLYATDSPPGLSGRRILIVHGTRDRIASPQRSAAVAKRIAAAADVRYVLVEGGKHAMLAHGSDFTEPAAEFARETLLSSESE